MDKLTLEQRYQIIQIYFENRLSIQATYKRLCDFYGASEQAICRTVEIFLRKYCNM